MDLFICLWLITNIVPRVHFFLTVLNIYIYIYICLAFTSAQTPANSLTSAAGIKNERLLLSYIQTQPSPGENSFFSTFFIRLDQSFGEFSRLFLLFFFSYFLNRVFLVLFCVTFYFHCLLDLLMASSVHHCSFQEQSSICNTHTKTHTVLVENWSKLWVQETLNFAPQRFDLSCIFKRTNLSRRWR